MKVKIKRIDKSLPLPVYETAGSVGFDFLVREKTIIPSKQLGAVPCNVIVETPPGYMLMVSPRSSTPRKKGLLPPNGVGVIDPDYAGPEDEIKFVCYNFSDTDTVLEKGDKVAQGIFVKVNGADWTEVEEMKNPTRGGLGSTDKK
jgi:dUTP pyrophosphatase